MAYQKMFSIIQGESTLKGGYNYFPLNVGMLRTIHFFKQLQVSIIFKKQYKNILYNLYFGLTAY